MNYLQTIYMMLLSIVIWYVTEATYIENKSLNIFTKACCVMLFLISAAQFYLLIRMAM